MRQPPEKTFAKLLREHRKARSWTQVRLALEAGFSEDYIRSLEGRRRAAPLETASVLATALRLSGQDKEILLEAARRAYEEGRESRAQQQTARLLAKLPEPPARTTYRTGRDEQIEDIVDRLTKRGGIISITGEPAIGKTTVALEVAHHYWDEGRIVLWGDAREGTAESVAQVESLLWHSVVGGRMPDSELQRRKRLSAALSEYKPLVVLDNLESAKEFDEIMDLAMQIGKGASILITSRRGIRARHGDNVRLEELPGDEGVQLFQRVGKAHGRQAVTPVDHRAIEFICVDTLAGHPGAIDIAAALWQGWPLEAILRGLRQKAMEVLEDPLRSDINRSMRISIGLSYDLLHEENVEAWELFPRLSVFQASFSHQAAEVVADVSGVLPSLQFLVDRSLVRFDGRRHSLHSVVREFGLEQLGEARVEFELAVAQYFLDFTQKHESDFSRLDEEKGNLFATMDWAEVHKEHRRVALELADLLSFFMHRRGLWVERLQRLQRALEIAEMIGEKDEIVRLRYALGNACRNQGDDRTAQDHFEKGLGLAQRLDDPGLIGGGFFLLAELAFRAQEHLRVRELAAQALGFIERAGAADQLPLVYSLLGSCEAELGNPDEAYAFFEKGLALARELEDTSVVSILLEDLCRLDIETQDFRRAEDRTQEYQRFAQSIDDPLAEGTALLIWGTLLWETSRPEEAVSHFRAAAAHFEQFGMPLKAVLAREGLVMAATQLDSLSLAEEQLEAIASIFLDLGNEEKAAFAFCRLGLVREELDRPGNAATTYEQALSLYSSLGMLDDPRAKDIALRLERMGGQAT